jgi:hypothetical protein
MRFLTHDVKLDTKRRLLPHDRRMAGHGRVDRGGQGGPELEELDAEF